MMLARGGVKIPMPQWAQNMSNLTTEVLEMIERELMRPEESHHLRCQHLFEQWIECTYAWWAEKGTVPQTPRSDPHDLAWYERENNFKPWGA